MTRKTNLNVSSKIGVAFVGLSDFRQVHLKNTKILNEIELIKN